MSQISAITRIHKTFCAQPRRSRTIISRQPVVTRAMFGGGSAVKDSIYDYTVKGIDGTDISLAKYKNKVLLIVNTASACGFTPQFVDLGKLQEKYSDLEVLAFPCNQFGSQDPGTDSEIKSFAQKKGFTGPMFAKSDVNGPNELPLFKFLKAKQGGLLTSDIKWNFTKFLVDKNGNVVKRYASTSAPNDIEADIKALI